MACKHVLALAFACAAGGACAEDWQFAYTGFSEDGAFVPDARVAGSFRGTDLDLDSIISLGELSSLVIDGREYLEGCLSLSDPYFRCEIDGFSYQLTGQLSVDANWWGNDEAFSGWGGGLRTGDRYSRWSYGWNEWSRTWYFTDQTVFDITPAPAVPEPASGLMLLAGLATLAGLGRRRVKGGVLSAI
ncbi:PEP-CTERM sorting domain-containing protein [Pseudoduganella sp. HUAS MS19]